MHVNWQNKKWAYRGVTTVLLLLSLCNAPTNEDTTTVKGAFEGTWQESGTKSLSEFTVKAITFKEDSFFCEEFRYSTQKMMTFTAGGMVPAACDPKNGNYYMAGVWDTLEGKLVFTGSFTDSTWVYRSSRTCPSNLTYKRTFAYTVADTVLTFTSEQVDAGAVTTLENPVTLYR